MNSNARAALSRRTLLGALGLTGVAAMSGCAGSFQQTAGTVPGKYAKRQHVVFWHSFGGTPLAVLTELVAKFNASQSDIYVEAQFQGSYEMTMQKLATAIVAKQVPDICVLSEITWRKIHLADALEPYNDFFDGDVQPDQFIDQFIDEGTVQGKLWWLPFARSTPIFYYNKTLFEKAGLSADGPESWEQLQEWAPAIMRQKTAAGRPKVLALGSTYASWYLQSNIWTWGGHYSNGLDVKFDTKPVQAAGQWMVDFVRKHQAAYLSQKPDQDMGSGITACYLSSTGGLTQAGLNAKGGHYQVGTAFLPQHDGNFGCPTGGSGIGVLKYAAKSRKEAAWQFLKFLAQPKNSAHWTVGTGYLPVVKAAQQEPELIKATKDKNYLTALKQLPKTQPQDLIRLIVSSAGDTMDEQLTKLYSSNASVPDVFDRLDKKLGSLADLIRETYDSHYK
ncbi:ABC transporter substrate-binding protein [Actinocatenispora comari]|uniref:ABC transporter substrate-binding protein n=1 Tax=Actinocatenispora comari TaxID=2807577 RepID=A0A8J4AHA9_9ACTN|nr:ABC transporter substrate-binding protein [Actinocatenispora comari]GIL30600.1 ABC transporter substrate-binding protein [Actinocatenispora comari]